MEGCEKEHITANMFDLVHTLDYNVHFASYLVQNGHIRESDIESLNVICQNRGNSAAVSELLRILQGRPGSYVALLETARTLCQTGAVAILKKLDRASLPSSSAFQKYSQPPAGLPEFLAKAKVSKKKSSVCIIPTLDIQVTSKKVRENVQGCSMHDYENFLRILPELSKSPSKIHIVSIPKLQHVKELLSELVISKMKRIQLVILTELVNEIQLMKFTEAQSSWRKLLRISFIVDVIQWEQLTLAHKHALKQKIKDNYKIKFQDELLVGALHGQLLVDLIHGNDIQLFKDTFPEELSYYICRRVISRSCISPKIFEQIFLPDVFAFTGMERHELSRLATNKMTDDSSVQLGQSRLTVKYMRLTSPNHFDKICGKCADPVHWLHFEDGGLSWIRSSGGIETLQKYVEQVQQHFDEEAFCQNLKQDSSLPICISDSPGMGKSVLLAQMGRRLMKTHSERKVFFIVISEFIKLLKQVWVNNLESSIKATLRSTICENKLGEAVLNSMLNSGNEISVELLCDGFDEVDSSDLDLAIETLKSIASSFKAIRLWVTSRPHLLQELERNLVTLGHKIEPFSEQDQICFLVNYWNRRKGNRNKEEGESTNLTQFARDCLKLLKGRLNSEEQDDIAGIPLQCLLIGEVYEEEAADIAGSDQVSLSPVPIIHFNSITDLYKCLIAKKFQKYLAIHESSDASDFGGSEVLMAMHVRLSIQLIFPERLSKLQHLLGVDEQGEMLKIGILEASSSTALPRFIHRTFAEYFLAWFIVDRLLTSTMWDSELRELYLEGVLACRNSEFQLFTSRQNNKTKSFEFAQPVVTYFLNSLISNFKHEPTHNLFKELLYPPQEHIRRGILHASATSDLIQIFHLFHQTVGLGSQSPVTIFNDEFLLLTINKSSLALIQLAFIHFEEHHQFELQLQSAALREAVHRGEFSIVEFLLKGMKWVGIVEKSMDGTRQLLFDCLVTSRANSEPVIDQKIQIIRMLTGINGQFLLEKDGNGRTPLLSRDVHLRLLMELVRLGVDMDGRDEEGKTFFQLTLARNTLPSGDIHSLLSIIPQEKLREQLKEKTPLGVTPLMNLVRFEYFEPGSDTLRMLKRLDADFNAVDMYGKSVLAIATETRRSSKTLKELVHCGADPHWRGREGETLLHVAAQYGSVEALPLLLDDLRLDVNAVDGEGLTSLDYAMRSKYAASFYPGMILNERGGSFKTVVNAQGQTWLHVAAEEGALNSLHLLIGMEVEVNARDKHGNTPLHLGVMQHGFLKPYFRITKLLLEANADPKALNNNRETPLQTALRNREVNFGAFELLRKESEMGWTSFDATLALHLLVQKGTDLSEKEFSSLAGVLVDRHGANVHYHDESGVPLLHLAVDCRNNLAVRFLVEQGVHVNSTSGWQETPLYVAVQRLGMVDIIQYLIDHGADVHTKSRSGNSFLQAYIFRVRFHDSPKTEFHSMVEYLAGKGLCNLFNMRDEKGKGYSGATPLQLAVLYLEPEQATLTLLRSNHVNFNPMDDNGSSLLSFAISGKRSMALLSHLVECGAEWKGVNKWGYSLLHTSAQLGSLDCLQFFLGLGGVDINGRNEDGNPALHSALLDKQQERILGKCLLLIENGADKRILNNAGNSALALALEKYEGADKEALAKLLAIS